VGWEHAPGSGGGAGGSAQDGEAPDCGAGDEEQRVREGSAAGSDRNGGEVAGEGVGGSDEGCDKKLQRERRNDWSQLTKEELMRKLVEHKVIVVKDKKKKKAEYSEGMVQVARECAEMESSSGSGSGSVETERETETETTVEAQDDDGDNTAKAAATAALV